MRSRLPDFYVMLTDMVYCRDEHGSGTGSESDLDLFWPDRFGVGLDFSAEPDRSWIVMYRVCQLK